MKDEVMSNILDFYVKSRDFNGITLSSLQLKFDKTKLKTIIEELIKEGNVTIATTENPHIKIFPEKTVEKQLEELNEHKGIICIYPSPSFLETHIEPDKFREEPFKRQLLLGTAQLVPIFFELPVLDRYFDDPRYLVLNDDYNGSISIKDEFYDTVPQKDKISIQTFGLGYNGKGERVIVVFLRYLIDLSPEHQRIWETYKIDEVCYLDPEYYKNNILGEWAENVSIYDAFREELFQINEMCKLMGKPLLFRRDFKDKRPEGFKIFLKPTSKNYYEFAHVVDKMVSDNINKDFFRGDIELKKETRRRDGKTEVQNKGTIKLLDEWLCSKFKIDEEFVKTIIGPIKKVRKERQDPAHKIIENVYDKSYHDKQNELIFEVYTAIRHIRLVFSNHPKVKGYKVPEWLYEGKIRRYVKEEFKRFD